jgi:hypothetical protein
MDNTFVELLRQALENQSPVGVFCDPNDAAAFGLAGSKPSPTSIFCCATSRRMGAMTAIVSSPSKIFFASIRSGAIWNACVCYRRCARAFPPACSKKKSHPTPTCWRNAAAVQRNEWMVRVSCSMATMSRGWVRGVTHDTVTITRVDHFGMADFEATVHLEAISELHCDDENLQDLRLLARRNETEPPAWLKI